MVKLNVDALAAKVGGRFHLAGLMQKRVRELMQGSPPLVDDVEGKSLEDIAALEIMQGKVWLLTGEAAEKERGKREKQMLSASADSAEGLPWQSLVEEKPTAE